VFFGCRNKENDHLHGTFWADLVGKSGIFQYPGGFVSAFSRDKKAEQMTHQSESDAREAEGNHSHRVDTAVLAKDEEESKHFPFSTMNKYYVQDAIVSCSAQVYEMIHFRGARVYVAGSTGQMPKDVRAALVHVLVKHGNMLHNQAEAYLKNMEKHKKYQVECWG
jgi:sulfite reductase alpha subunit-like flavoprotein